MQSVVGGFFAVLLLARFKNDAARGRTTVVSHARTVRNNNINSSSRNNVTICELRGAYKVNAIIRLGYILL